MDKKEIIRRSISLPKTIDDKITAMVNEYSYSVKNELIVDLLELGILKYTENVEMKDLLNKLINRIENVLDNLESSK